MKVLSPHSPAIRGAGRASTSGESTNAQPLLPFQTGRRLDLSRSRTWRAPVGVKVAQTQRSARVARASATLPFSPPTVSVASAPFEKYGPSFIYAPPGYPKAVVHFLGGAFIGKTPDVFYSTFIDLLTSAGYLIIATPYNVTFDHTKCAVEVRERFLSCLQHIDLQGLPTAKLSPGQASELPVFGVGHSNGAFLHVLLGTKMTSETASIPQGNVIISYNNKPASVAVPFFDQVGPAVVQLTPVVQQLVASGPGILLAAAESALEALVLQQSQLPELLPQEIAEPVGRFADQLGPVLAQVQSGVSEFTPPPSENLMTVSSSYAVPRTLLIQFSDDSIDETRSLEPVMRERVARLPGGGGRVELAFLNGTHATPLAPDVRWQVEGAFSPADAVALALKAAALSDLRNLAKAVVSWLDTQVR